MQKYSNNIINQYGAPISGASVKVLSIDGSLAPIYSDNNSSPLTNPTTSDEFGQFAFYAKNGRYSIAIEKQGVISQTLQDVLLEDLELYSGGSVTQSTSKSTSVALNKPCGRVTTSNSSIASGESVVFVVNNSLYGEYDTVRLGLLNTIDGMNYRIDSSSCAAGLFAIRITNVSAAPKSEILIINFSVIKGSIS